MNDLCHHLDDYLDGLLPPGAVEEFESHLETCPACNLTVAGVAGLDEQIRHAWLEIKAPPRLRQAIFCGQVTAGQSEVSVSRHRLGTYMLALAASIVIFTAATYWLAGKTGDTLRRGKTVIDPGSLATVDDWEIETDDAPVTILHSPYTNVGSVQKHETILVPQVRSSPNFTIVKAYPTFKSQRSTKFRN